MRRGVLLSALCLATLLGIVGIASVGAAGPHSGPEYGRTFEVEPVHGIVRVRLPGDGGLTTLRSGRQVPVGTVVDTRAGRVRLTSARDADSTQSAEFFNGEFRVSQPPAGRPITVLKLLAAPRCGRGRPAIAPRPGGNGLWGNGRGNFRTVGSHGSATVRGTIWWSRDRCDGTHFRVKRGVVTIRDFTRHTTVEIRAGDAYRAPAGR